MAEQFGFREQDVLRRLWRRWLTPGGNLPNMALGSGVSSIAVVMPRKDVDGGYGVLVTPSWETMVWVTDKSDTGFTVHFGTATPDALQVIDYATFRTED